MNFRGWPPDSAVPSYTSLFCCLNWGTLLLNEHNEELSCAALCTVQERMIFFPPVLFRLLIEMSNFLLNPEAKPRLFL